MRLLGLIGVFVGALLSVSYVPYIALRFVFLDDTPQLVPDGFLFFLVAGFIFAVFMAWICVKQKNTKQSMYPLFLGAVIILSFIWLAMVAVVFFIGFISQAGYGGSVIPFVLLTGLIALLWPVILGIFYLSWVYLRDSDLRLS